MQRVPVRAAKEAITITITITITNRSAAAADARKRRDADSVADLRCAYFRAASAEAWARFRETGRARRRARRRTTPPRPGPAFP